MCVCVRVCLCLFVCEGAALPWVGRELSDQVQVVVHVFCGSCCSSSCSFISISISIHASCCNRNDRLCGFLAPCNFRVCTLPPTWPRTWTEANQRPWHGPWDGSMGPWSWPIWIRTCESWKQFAAWRHLITWAPTRPDFCLLFPCTDNDDDFVATFLSFPLSLSLSFSLSFSCDPSVSLTALVAPEKLFGATFRFYTVLINVLFDYPTKWLVPQTIYLSLSLPLLFIC